MIKVSTTGMAVSLKTDLRFPIPGQQGHGGRIIQYGKASSYGRTQYNTLPTYIRNAIDHPDSGNRFTDDELRRSIEFLIQLL